VTRLQNKDNAHSFISSLFAVFKGLCGFFIENLDPVEDIPFLAVACHVSKLAVIPVCLKICFRGDSKENDDEKYHQIASSQSITFEKRQAGVSVKPQIAFR
jgi:hypothetical protein